MFSLQYTPILLYMHDFYNLISEIIETDPDIPPEAERTQNYILAPRYYVLIYPPTQVQGNTPKPLLKVDIHRTGILKDIIRLKLKPSKGYGINACYRLEFWRWYPIVSQSEETKPRKLTQEFIKQEYLYVPSINPYTYYLDWHDRFNCNSNWWNRYPLYYRQSLNVTKEISVLRRYKSSQSTIIVDEIQNPQDALDLFVFTNKDIKLYETIQTIEGKLYDKYVSSIGIEYSNIYPSVEFTPESGSMLYYGQAYVNGTATGTVAPIKYKVDYIRPLQGRELFYSNSYHYFKGYYLDY